MRTLLLAAVSLLLATGACGGGGGSSEPAAPLGRDYVLPPEQVHYGLTYAEWSTRWYQWALELPYSTHPLEDDASNDPWQGQVDPVWFIGGEFATVGHASDGFAERTVTLPYGKSLFFPIACNEVDNDFCTPPGWVPLSATELRDLVDTATYGVVDVFCEIDGDRFLDAATGAGAQRFRATSGAFSALMQADNQAYAECGAPYEPLLVDPAYSDGLWVMVAPLPVGEHTIHFGATFPGPVFSANPFVLDITYHITVVP